MKYKKFLIGALVGLLIGIFTTFLFGIMQRSISILFPLGFLKTYFGMNTWEWIGVSPVFILIHILSWILIGILCIILFKLIIKLIKKIKKRKIPKIHRIFIYLILIEIILTTILFHFPKVYYSTPCNLPNFFHPFGTEFSGMCIQVLAPGPSPLFFFSEYILCLTIISYFIYLSYIGLKKLFKLNKSFKYKRK